MKRIALITTAPGSVSGVTVFMELLQRKLVEQGYDAQLLRPEPSILGAVNQLGYPLGYALLKERLKGFDLVIGNSVGLAGAADLPIKIIYNAHSNSIGGNLLMRRAYEQVTPAERHYLNRLLGPLADLDWRSVGESLDFNKAVFEVDRIMANRADKVIAVAPGVTRNIIDHFEVPQSKTQTIYNGIEPHWLEERDFDPVITGNTVNVVFSGRASRSPLLIFLKGLDRLLGAMRNLRGLNALSLLYVQDQSAHQVYRELFAQNGIDTRFNLDHAGLRAHLRKGDIYVHTSRTEACSLSLFEAMGSGMAVVTFPAGAVLDVIENGQNGFVVHSIQEMRERIQELATNDTLRLRLGRVAQETVRKNFLVDKMVDQYIGAIESVL